MLKAIGCSPVVNRLYRCSNWRRLLSSTSLLCSKQIHVHELFHSCLMLPCNLLQLLLVCRRLQAGLGLQAHVLLQLFMLVSSARLTNRKPCSKFMLVCAGRRTAAQACLLRQTPGITSSICLQHCLTCCWVTACVVRHFQACCAAFCNKEKSKGYVCFSLKSPEQGHLIAAQIEHLPRSGCMQQGAEPQQGI